MDLRVVLASIAIIGAIALDAPVLTAQPAQSPTSRPHYWQSAQIGGPTVLPLSYRKRWPPFYCDERQCYKPELVAYGLLPKRSYRVVFAKDRHVCTTIERALNWALTRSNAELDKVWAGELDPIAVMNPIFSSPVFLRWHYLENMPPPWLVGGLRPVWIIIPFLNDGVPRLMTGYGKGEPTLWSYSSEELRAGHWDDFRNYARAREVPEESPLHFVMYYRPPKEPPNILTAPAVYHFPNLPRARWHTDVWRYSERIGQVEIVFAEVDGRIFLVGHDGMHDTMYVADVSQRPGDDICYLDSTISRGLAKTLARTR